MSGRRRLAGA